MAKSNLQQEQTNDDPGKANKTETKITFKEAKNDPAVKEALKKEKQPVNPGDLSPIHNTKETGTSGGDQRASKTEQNKEDTNK